jgi:hypothetical protein
VARPTSQSKCWLSKKNHTTAGTRRLFIRLQIYFCRPLSCHNAETDAKTKAVPELEDGSRKRKGRLFFNLLLLLIVNAVLRVSILFADGLKLTTAPGQHAFAPPACCAASYFSSSLLLYISFAAEFEAKKHYCYLCDLLEQPNGGARRVGRRSFQGGQW